MQNYNTENDGYDAPLPLVDVTVNYFVTVYQPLRVIVVTSAYDLRCLPYTLLEFAFDVTYMHVSHCILCYLYRVLTPSF